MQIKSRIKYISNICVDHGEGENNREEPDQEQSLPAGTGRYSSNVNREEKMFLVSSLSQPIVKEFLIFCSLNMRICPRACSW